MRAPGPFSGSAQIVLPRDAVPSAAMRLEDLVHACEASEEVCSICLADRCDVALQCGHVFHRAECLERWLATRPSCPNCGQRYGPQIGAMPDGEMAWHQSNMRLSGHSCGTIVLHFNFPSGVTGTGERYAGRSQHAFLPNDPEGRELLGLFSLAFRRRVLFGLGPSMATGQVRPTFSIHLKTSTCGGPERHGYPDPGYHRSALQELRRAGIEPSDVPAGSIDLGPSRSVGFGVLAQLLVVWDSVCFLLAWMGMLEDSSTKGVTLPVLCTMAALSLPGSKLYPCIFVLLALYKFSQNDSPLASNLCLLADALYSLSACLIQQRAPRGKAARVLIFIAHVVRGYVVVPFTPLRSVSILLLLGRARGWGQACLLGGASCACSVWVLYRRCRSPQGSALTQPLLATAGGTSVPEAVAAAGALEAPAPAAPLRGSRASGGPVTDDDWAAFAETPSLRGRLNAASLHESMLRRSPELVRSRMHVVVKELLERELRFQEEYTVFYHSYSIGCFLYEFQAALATLLLGYPRGGPPVMRIIRKHFEGCDSLVALAQERECNQTDHSEGFRNVAVSAVVSWFASGSYTRSFMMTHAVQGWSGSKGDMGDMTKLVERALRECGLLEGGDRDMLVADLLEVGEKWGLDMSQYQSRAGRTRQRGEPTCPGHILQIFVKNSVVDSVAYGAKPLGKRAQDGSPITAWLARQCPLEGQARLLAHPDLFIGSLGNLVHVFPYASCPLYGDAQRRLLLAELEDLLSPHFGDAGTGARAQSAASLGFESGVASQLSGAAGSAGP